MNVILWGFIKLISTTLAKSVRLKRKSVMVGGFGKNKRMWVLSTEKGTKAQQLKRRKNAK